MDEKQSVTFFSTFLNPQRATLTYSALFKSFYAHPNISDIFVGDKIDLFNLTFHDINDRIRSTNELLIWKRDEMNEFIFAP